MKKQIKIKLIILLIAFVAMGTGTFLSLVFQETEPSMTTMQPVSLPLLYMQTPGGTLINPANGYLGEIDGRTVFHGITPLDENRNVTTAIYPYGERITGVTYRVIDLENGRLLEDTKVELESQKKQTVVYADMDIKNLIEKGKQYLLEIRVSTPNYARISYFQRILWQDDLNVEKKLDFVKQFHGYTYSASGLSEIERWIETDGTGDNTNYGHVGIHSTSQQIGWGALQPKVEGSVVPTILDISDAEAQISLNYRVATPCTGMTYDTYYVEDYYRVREHGEEIYLMAYDRRANQRFDGNEDLQASGRINLGIKENDEPCEAMCDENGKYSYFVDSGQLWCYARKENKFTNVFSFGMEDFSVHVNKTNFHIKIVSVDEKGNANFLVVGYMSRGQHEGYTGVSLYQYRYGENVVEELAFVPVSMMYEEMKDCVGDVAYISGDQLFLKVKEVLYSIDLVSREIMVLTENLVDGQYAATSDGKRIAYQMGTDSEDETGIRILDFALGTETTIEAGAYGNKSAYDRIRLIGYIEDDIVFGIFDCRDICAPDGVNRILPMYGIYILDGEYGLVKEYRESNIFVTGASIEGMRVNLTRIVRNGDGKYVSTTIDQLMNRKENNEKSGIYTDIVATKAREKEIYLYLPSSAGNTEEVSLRYSKEVIFREENTLAVDVSDEKEERYYAYGFGRCLGVFHTLKDGVRAAAAREGFVLDSRGMYLWKRAHNMNSIVWNDAYKDLTLEDFNANLTGLSLNQILYFISDGKFVLVKCSETGYGILYDYDNSSVFYYDQEAGKLQEKSREDAEKLFVGCGNVYLTTQ